MFEVKKGKTLLCSIPTIALATNCIFLVPVGVPPRLGSKEVGDSVSLGVERGFRLNGRKMPLEAENPKRPIGGGGSECLHIHEYVSSVTVRTKRGRDSDAPRPL